MIFSRKTAAPVATKGVTMQATGLAPAPSDQEVGSAATTPIREIVPALISAYQRTQTYAQMMHDSSCDISIRAVKTPVLGADLFTEPFSSDQFDLDVADFVDSNFFGGLSAPLATSLNDILNFFEDGYSVLEKVYEQREWAPKRSAANTRVFTMLKKFGVRPANTIKQIVYDNNGGPKTIIQNAIQADGNVVEKPMDISKLVIFTFNRKGGDLTGKSLLRTAYPHWYYKTHFYKIDAIQKERHGIGVPYIKLQPGFKEADKVTARTLVRNLRTNEEAGFVLPPGMEAGFAELSGNPVDVLASASHHNTMILLNVMAQFLLSGTEGGGGRATAGSQVDMFMKSLRYVANLICDMINMYVIPELVVYNFKTTNFPKLKVRNIGETRDLQMLGAALGNLLSQGGITMDDPTENWIRQVFDMPFRDPSTTRTTPNPVAASSGDNPVVPTGNGKKGAVGNNGGQGNTGKPPNAFTSAEEWLSTFAIPAQTTSLDLTVPIEQTGDTVVHNHHADGDVKIENTFEHQHQHDVHVEGANVHVDAPPAPVVNIHLADNQIVQQLKPTAAIATKLDDGTTRIEYEYDQGE